MESCWHRPGIHAAKSCICGTVSGIRRTAYGHRAQGATVRKNTAAMKAGFVTALDFSLIRLKGYLVDGGSNKIIMYVKELWFIVHLSHPQTLAIPCLLPSITMARRLWCRTSNHSVIKHFWLGLRKLISECFMDKLMWLISNCLPMWFLNYWRYRQAWPSFSRLQGSSV